jgi:hypothetical protein
MTVLDITVTHEDLRDAYRLARDFAEHRVDPSGSGLRLPMLEALWHSEDSAFQAAGLLALHRWVQAGIRATAALADKPVTDVIDAFDRAIRNDGRILIHRQHPEPPALVPVQLAEPRPVLRTVRRDKAGPIEEIEEHPI